MFEGALILEMSNFLYIPVPVERLPDLRQNLAKGLVGLVWFDYGPHTLRYD